MRPRVAAALVVAVALAGAIGLVAASSGGGGSGGAGQAARGGLSWGERPQLVTVPSLPRDGILAGRVRNDTIRAIDLEADDLVVVDDRGDRWRTSGRFLSGFAHGLWPPGQEVAVGSDAERERLGEIARLAPGEAAPLTVAWRRPPGGGRPVRIEIGGRALPIPGPPPAV